MQISTANSIACPCTITSKANVNGKTGKSTESWLNHHSGRNGACPTGGTAGLQPSHWCPPSGTSARPCSPPTLPQRKIQEGSRECMRSLVCCLSSGIPVTSGVSASCNTILSCSPQNAACFKAQFKCLLLFCKVFPNSILTPERQFYQNVSL